MIDYPVSLYAQTRDGIKASARAVVPQLVEIFTPPRVLDVGCGEGWWAREFARRGCDVVGIDGPHVTPEIDTFHARDLEQPLPDDVGRFHLAVCLEVAEHLSPGRADSFVTELCAIARTVVFSAAIPGQGGAGHVNEQWPTYWVEKFASHGYPGTGALRARLWDDVRVEPWYRQNLLVFGDLGPLETDGCQALVHPEIWGWYR